MMRGAFAMMSCGNITLSMAPVRIPSASGSIVHDAVDAEMPPTPEQREAEPELDARCRTPR